MRVFSFVGVSCGFIMIFMWCWLLGKVKVEIWGWKNWGLEGSEGEGY